GERPLVTYRPSGEDNILIEYGPMELDINLRFRVHVLMEWIDRQPLAGIIEVTPGIRSLQIHYDSQRLRQTALLDYLQSAEYQLGSIENFEIPSRVVYLPLS